MREDIDRYPIESLLAFEISIGWVNKEKLFEKLAAALDMVNREVKAFDLKTNQDRTLIYNDAIIFRMKAGKEVRPVAVISPRLKNGQYVAHAIRVGVYKQGVPDFTEVGAKA